MRHLTLLVVTFPLKDAVRLMIVFSDNTATDLVLDQIGIPSTNGSMEQLGFKNTQVHAKVFKASTTTIDKARSEKSGLGTGRPAECGREMISVRERDPLLSHARSTVPSDCFSSGIGSLARVSL